jgi:hypothetical protein
MQIEIWKEITNYEGLYEVSNFGLVKSLKRSVPRKSGKLLNIKEKILNLSIDEHGYFKVQLWKNNKPFSIRVHRLVARCFVDNFKPDLQVNHIDGNKLNNYYKNLEWCTVLHNQEEAVRLGLKKQTKVNMYKEGTLISNFCSISKAAEITKINKSSIFRCLNGKFKKCKGFTWEYAK